MIFQRGPDRSERILPAAVEQDELPAFADKVDIRVLVRNRVDEQLSNPPTFSVPRLYL